MSLLRDTGILLTGLLLAVDSSALPLQAVTVTGAQSRLAICNDGSSYVYHRRAGTGDGLNKWMIYVEGGGACSSVAACQERQRTDPGKMTAETSPTLNRGGILDDSQSANPEFYNWNAVFLSYCSSDDHSGDRAASAETGGYHFRGFRTVRATIEDLLVQGGAAPSLADAEYVVFAGGSAGGAGQLTHLDWVADQVHRTRPDTIVRGFTDSFFHPPLYTYQPTQATPVAQDANDPQGGNTSFSFWNAQVPPECRARYPDVPFVCLGGTFMVETLRTPTFIHEDQLDEQRLRSLGAIEGDFSPPISCDRYPADRKGWLSDYTEIVRSFAAAARFGGAWSPAVGYHTGATNSQRYDTHRVDGQTMRTTFVNWLYDRPGLKIAIEPADCELNPTGAWYDPAQNGHGLVVQQLLGRRVLATWYTFDPEGRQAWFFGDGAYDGRFATLTNVRTLGTFFPPNFVPTDAQNQPFGTMTLTFDSCRSGRVDFDLPSGFGRGSMSLTRLTQPTDVECDGVAAQAATGALASASGAWYDASQNGHGLFVENLPGNQVLAAWYTFGPAPTGGQAWMIGVGTASGSSVQFSMLKTTGGRFIPNFNPAAISNPVLGPATLTLSDCNAGRLDYAFGLGFGSGALSLTRLTKPMGVTCLP
jgi:hypothetical protein